MTTTTTALPSPMGNVLDRFIYIMALAFERVDYKMTEPLGPLPLPLVA